MTTCRERILDRLNKSPFRLAVHEFNLMGESETAISARLREMARGDKPEVVGQFRKGDNVKEWGIAGRWYSGNNAEIKIQGTDVIVHQGNVYPAVIVDEVKEFKLDGNGQGLLIDGARSKRRLSRWS